MSRDRLSRRALLAGAATAGAFSGSEAHVGRGTADAPLVAIGRGGDHPDAELLALEHAWRISAARCRRADRRQTIAERRLVHNPRPDGQLWREGDEALLGIEPDQPHPRDPLERAPGYFNPNTIKVLELALALLAEIDQTPFPGRTPRAAAVARLREILDADAAWRRDVKADWERAGLKAAEAAADSKHQRNKDLRFKILALPARTMEGVAFKVRVGAWCFGDPSTTAEDELNAFVHGGDAAGETFAFAVLQDLIRLKRGPRVGREERRLPTAA